MTNQKNFPKAEKIVLANIVWVPKWDHKPTDRELEIVREVTDVRHVTEGGIPNEYMTFHPKHQRDGYQYGYAFPNLPRVRRNVMTFFWSRSPEGSKIVGVYGLTEIGNYSKDDETGIIETIKCPLELAVRFENFIDYNSNRHGNYPRQANFIYKSSQEARNIIHDAKEANKDYPQVIEVLKRIEAIVPEGEVMTNKQVEEIKDLLFSKRQIILCGPPGTSKTYLAEIVAEKIVIEQERKVWLVITNPKNPEHKWSWIGNKFFEKDSEEDFSGIVEDNIKNTLPDDLVLCYEAGVRNIVGLAYISKPHDEREGKLYFYVKPIAKLEKPIKLEDLKEILKDDYPGILRATILDIKIKRTNDLLKRLFENNEIAKKKYLYHYWIKIVQFHPSYTYEDFVRGLVAVPRSPEEGGGVTFEPQDKIFAHLCKRALANKEKKFVLIIDEINRADMSKVFGELIYGLEYRNEPVDTPYEVEGSSKLIIPPNLYIIGTMNTADKSIALLDYALRRRFAFYHLYPDESVLEKFYEENKAENGTKEKAISLFKKVLELFEGNHDIKVGHTYFMAKSVEELKTKFIYEVAPLIIEYIKAREEGVKKENNAIWDAYNEGPEKMNEELEKIYESEQIVLSSERKGEDKKKEDQNQDKGEGGGE